MKTPKCWWLVTSEEEGFDPHFMYGHPAGIARKFGSVGPLTFEYIGGNSKSVAVKFKGLDDIEDVIEFLGENPALESVIKKGSHFILLLKEAL